MQGADTMHIKGIVRTGLGRGKKFIPVYSALFLEHLGFEPFFGTLNISITNETAHALSQQQKYHIPPFLHNETEYGAVEYIPAYIGKIPCGIIFPVKSTHPHTIIEVIAPVYLRDALPVIDGDELEVVLDIQKKKVKK